MISLLWRTIFAIVPLPFIWIKYANPKSERERFDCFIGKLRLGAIWFDEDRNKWCSYFDNAHTTERTHETEAEAKASVETQSYAAFASR